MPLPTVSAAALGLITALVVGMSPAPAVSAEGAPIRVSSDGSVAVDPAIDAPQITRVRVLEEARILEIHWDRYVDEIAAVDPANITLTNGSSTIALVAKRGSGPTDTVFFDRANRQMAATAANSMARLPDDLHMASIAYTGTIDDALGITVTVDGDAIRDAAGRPARDAQLVDVPRLSHYTQSVTTASGVRVKAGPRVAPTTLDLAAAHVDVMLAKTSNGVGANMAAKGCSLAVYGARENAYTVPEHRRGYDPGMYDVEGYGGSQWNGCVSSISERNVLRARGEADRQLNTGYPDENILAHEFGHAVRLVGIETLADGSLSERLWSAYENAYNSGLWPNTYAISNVDEYFATLSAIWFDNMAEAPTWSDGVRSPINTRAELLAYDPQAHALLAEVYPDATPMPAPWNVPSPDRFHATHTAPPAQPVRATATGVDFSADRFRIVTDSLGAEFQIDRFAGDSSHPQRDMVLWRTWGDGVWRLTAVGDAYAIESVDGGALSAVSESEVAFRGIRPDRSDERQLWRFEADDSSSWNPHDGRLVNVGTGTALRADGRVASGRSLTLTAGTATRWMLEDTTRTIAQGVPALLAPRPALIDALDRVSVTVSTRCVAAKTVLVVSVRNGADTAIDVRFTTEFGGKQITSIAPGKTASHVFSTRMRSVPAGEVSAKVTGVVDGVPVRTERTVAHIGAGC